ncbi:MAG: DUF4148 domain-containing protein [Noviherbaspirillum sp.]
MTAFGAALIAASSSFAVDTQYGSFSNIVSTKSRAEVIADLNAARANGSLEVHDGTYPILAQEVAPGKTRAQVTADLKQFRAAHPYLNGDLNYPDAAQARFPGMDAPSSGQ